jgi:hypothetical protein
LRTQIKRFTRNLSSWAGSLLLVLLDCLRLSPTIVANQFFCFTTATLVGSRRFITTTGFRLFFNVCDAHRLSSESLIFITRRLSPTLGDVEFTTVSEHRKR